MEKKAACLYIDGNCPVGRESQVPRRKGSLEKVERWAAGHTGRSWPR